MSTEPRTAPPGPAPAATGPAENRRTLAGLARKQSRAHRALATLVEKEVRLHVHLKKLADQSAEHQSARQSARMLRWLGGKHVEQEEMGRKEVWAHTQLAASTEARALAIEQVLDPGGPAGGAGPSSLPQETKEAEEARLLLVRHAKAAKEEESGRARDAALARLATTRIQRQRKRGVEPKALPAIQGESEAARVRRMTNSARTHMVMSRLLVKQARAHELLAQLLEREAAALAFLAGAGESGQPRYDPAPAGPWANLAPGTGDSKDKPMAKPIWAHERLAARSTARAAWHESCATFVTTSLQGPARPRTGGRRPAWLEGKR